MKWRLYIVSVRLTTAFDDCIICTLQTRLCTHAAFETNPQGYRWLSSNTARGVFRRGNCAHLSVRQFPTDRFNDGMAQFLGRDEFPFFSLSRSGSTRLPAHFFHCSIFYICIHILLCGIVWCCNSFFFPGHCVRADMRSAVSVSDTTESLYFRKALTVIPVIESPRVSLMIAFTPA